MSVARGPWRARDPRRDEIRRRVAALTAERSFPRPLGAAGEGSVAARLAAELPALGPVFAAFGRYLSARVDLLPEPACRDLDAIPELREPMPFDAVRALVTGAPGAPFAPAVELDPEPLRSTLTFQDHRARLGDGRTLRVRVARPEPELARELALLPLLAPALSAAGMDPARLDDAVAELAAAYAGAADLGAQAAALQALAADGAASGLGLCAPRVVPELSSSAVLVLEELPGETLAEVGRRGGRGAEDAAARLCQIWLHQARRGRVLPVEFGGDDVLVLADQRLAWTGGVFVNLPPSARDALWEYLAAAAAHDPDRAAAALLREMEGRPPDDGSLVRRLRQLVPFRDGGFEARDDLAGYVFLHWRAAAGEGWRPRPHLAGFCRGLVRVSTWARRAAPARDLLREGVDSVRLADGLGDVAGLFGRDRAQEVLGGYATALLAMPQRLNEMMTLLAEGRASVKVEIVEPPPERRRRDRSTSDLAILLAMAAVVLLAHHLAVAAAYGPWPERIGLLLLGVLAGALLRGRRRHPLRGER